MNDTTEGIRVPVQPALPNSLLAGPFSEPLWPQDTMTLTLFGTAAGGEIDVAGLVVWYEDLPGISARLLMPEDVQRRGVHAVPVLNAALATLATGEWGGAEALNADSDLLKPNTDYALLGARCSLAVGIIGVRSSDWGNVRVPIPGNITEPDVGWNYLVNLSRKTGLPCIPILNSGNRAGIFVDALQDEAGANPDCHLNLVELAP